MSRDIAEEDYARHYAGLTTDQLAETVRSIALYPRAFTARSRRTALLEAALRLEGPR